MKSKTDIRWYTFSLALLIMIVAIISNREKPEMYINEPLAERKIDVISIKRSVMDSLFKSYAASNNLIIAMDSSNSEILRVKFLNINSQADILGQDWSSGSLTNKSLDKDGYNIKVTGSRPFDINIDLKTVNGFVAVPTGILFKVMYR